MFYIYSYLACLFFALAWLFYKESADARKYLGRLFGLSFLLYLGALFLENGSLPYKGLILARDMGILLGLSFLLNTFSSMRWLFVLLFGASAAGGYYFYQPTLVQTFQAEAESNSTAPLPELASEAELLLELSEAHQLSDLQNLLEQYGLEASTAFQPLQPESTELDDFWKIDIPESRLEDLAEIKQALEAHPAVDYLEHNELIPFVAPLAAAPAPQRRRPRELNDPALSELWGAERIQLQELHRYLREKGLRPKRKTLIAIIDTGVEADHEDLNGNYRSMQAAYDSDVLGHGTHCAGIAAAVSNNGKGIASFSPGNAFVEVTSIKVFSDRGSTTQERVIDGMIEAVDKGAKVLSMSLGGPASQRRERVYREAVKYAQQRGAIVVVAAGNENVHAHRRVPAGVVGVITVSAMDIEGGKASFSNDVSEVKMGISAPGTSIYSTFPNNEYRHLSGTSMATPYVAGLVGLMKALEPSLGTQRAYQILHQSGSPTKAGAATGRCIAAKDAIQALLKR